MSDLELCLTKALTEGFRQYLHESVDKPWTVPFERILRDSATRAFKEYLYEVKYSPVVAEKISVDKNPNAAEN